jgi:predicted amidohydrolase YtcJ
LEPVKADYENMGAKPASTGFQFRAMIDAGLEPAASTDMTGIYLGNINPFQAIYAMVTRHSDLGCLPARAGHLGHRGAQDVDDLGGQDHG